MKLEDIPGKTSKDGWLPLATHLTDTAGIMGLLERHWMSKALKRAVRISEDLLGSLCIFLGLVHDIGKMTAVMMEKFNKIRSIDADKSPHAIAGQAILLKYGCPSGIALIVGAHHEKPEEMDGNAKHQIQDFPRNYYGDSKDEWEAIWEQWIAFSLEKSGFGSMEDLPKPDRSSQMLLTGLLIMADWIASNTEYFPFDTNQIPRDRVKTGWEKLDLTRPWEAKRNDFSSTFGFAPNSIQQTVMDAMNESEKPGLVILEAPMGEGKTEAALSAAEIVAQKNGSGGLFFGLPNQATVNGIFPRIARWAEKQGQTHAIRKAYSNAVTEDCPGLVVHEWLAGYKRSLLPEFVIGTADQLFMTALQEKHVMLRHLGIAGKTVVLDEVHSYGAYTSRYLDRTLNWLGKYQVPVIMLSATLTKQRKSEMISAYLGKTVQCDDIYPALTWTDGEILKQKELHTSQKSIKVTIQSKIPEAGKVGVICNTIKRAQEIAEKIRLSGREVVLIHSRFTACDRAEKEQAIWDAPIVVGTQVLEQSLDIDFDLLITDLCPMDLLLQRMGRLHRHKRSDAVCVVMDSEDVYDKEILAQTKALLPEEIVLPDMIHSLVEDTYSGENLKEYRYGIMEERRKAEAFMLASPSGSSIKGLLDNVTKKTVRDGDPTMEVTIGANGKVRIPVIPGLTEPVVLDGDRKTINGWVLSYDKENGFKFQPA